MNWIDVKNWLLKLRVAQGLCLSLGLLLVIQTGMALKNYRSLDRFERSPLLAVPEPQTLAASLIDAKLRLALFGDYRALDQGISPITDSKLRLKLVGILSAADPEHSQVIVRTENGQDAVLKVGDSISGSVAVLKTILPDGIVILHNGALERLSLPKNELRFEAPPKPLD